MIMTRIRRLHVFPIAQTACGSLKWFHHSDARGHRGLKRALELFGEIEGLPVRVEQWLHQLDDAAPDDE
jgi:hypothetical protein